MKVIQVRLTKEMVDKLDALIEKGIYPTKSEGIRDSVRRLIYTSKIKIKKGRK